MHGIQDRSRSLKLLCTSLVMAAVVGTASAVVAQDKETWDDQPPWLGTWHAIPQVARILGLAQEGSVRREKLQIEFFASRESAIALAGKDLVERVESCFAKRMGGRHEIIAAGRWKNEGELIESLCVVTQIQGARFLWFGDPSVTLTGAEVSYIRGVDPEHDLLVLDSQVPSFMKQRLPRTVQTKKFFELVAYQRETPTEKE